MTKRDIRIRGSTVVVAIIAIVIFFVVMTAGTAMATASDNGNGGGQALVMAAYLTDTDTPTYACPIIAQTQISQINIGTSGPAVIAKESFLTQARRSFPGMDYRIIMPSIAAQVEKIREEDILSRLVPIPRAIPSAKIHPGG